MHNLHIAYFVFIFIFIEDIHIVVADFFSKIHYFVYNVYIFTYYNCVSKDYRVCTQNNTYC